MKLLRAHEVTIAWTPTWWDADDPMFGKVRVGREDPILDWTEPYALTTGAVWTARDRLRGVKSLCQLLLDFNTLVVRDGIDPQVAHREFMKIDEYVAHVSRDIPGVEERLLLVKGRLGTGLSAMEFE